MSAVSKPIPTPTSKQLGRFWAKVDKSGGVDSCWPWLKTVARTGYGLCSLNNKTYLAHRLALGFVCAPPDTQLLALHTCDNRKCCNPKHLYWGNAKDNCRDRDSRGRSNVLRGEQQGSSKLAWDSVSEIRAKAATVSYRELARQYGVTHKVISNIVRNLSWKT